MSFMFYNIELHVELSLTQVELLSETSLHFVDLDSNTHYLE